MAMRLLTATEVWEALPMPEAIDAMREAFGALANGKVDLPSRVHQRVGSTDLSTLTMPGVMSDPPRVGAKLLTLNPANPTRSLPVIHGLVIMFDPDTGAPVGLLDGTAITALRTGAVSGLATDLLARRDAGILGVIGAGVQARSQLTAVCAVRAIREVRVWSRTPDRATDFARTMSTPERPVRVVGTPAEAVEEADVICTATPATRPLVGLAEVRPGVHVNAVGSYTREMQELGPHLIREARVVVDSIDAAMAEAGELIRAAEAGVIDPDNLIELGEVVNDRHPGRESEQEITLFKSVGLAVQDLAAASRALARAATSGIGREFDPSA